MKKVTISEGLLDDIIKYLKLDKKRFNLYHYREESSLLVKIEDELQNNNVEIEEETKEK